MFAAKFVELGQDRRWGHGFTIDADGVAALETDFDIFGRVGRFFGADCALVNVVGGVDGGVFEDFAFGGSVQQVGINRTGRFAAFVLRDRDLVLFCEGQQLGAARQIPFAPRGDNLDVGVECIGGQLKTDLVIAFAGGAVGDRVGAGFFGDFHETFGD